MLSEFPNQAVTRVLSLSMRRSVRGQSLLSARRQSRSRPSPRNNCRMTYHISYILSLISLGREKETITKTKSNTLTTPAPQHPQPASYPHPSVDQTNKHNTTSSAKESTKTQTQIQRWGGKSSNSPPQKSPSPSNYNSDTPQYPLHRADPQSQSRTDRHMDTGNDISGGSGRKSYLRSRLRRRWREIRRPWLRTIGSVCA